jgi:hypothetical protein
MNTKYDGPVARFLALCRCNELSEITPEHLDRFTAYATPTQRSKLIALWNGRHDPPADLQILLAEIFVERHRQQELELQARKLERDHRV